MTYMRLNNTLRILVLVSCALLFFDGGSILAQDITVPEGTPVSLVAYSNDGAPNPYDFPCGPGWEQSCYGGTFQPNGNISWTVDGVATASTYDTIDSDYYTCGVDDLGNNMACYDYWDESGYTAVLPSGWHTVTASISASQDSSAAFSTTWSIYITSTKSTPTISVSCAPNPITYGPQTSNCTTTVSGGATGTVSFQDNGSTWNSPSLNNGQASAGGFNYDGAGNHTVTAIYNGDGNYNSVSATTVLTITKATPTISVSCAPNPITYGPQISNCTATVSDGATGTVSFQDNGNTWNSPSLNNGQASAAGFNYDGAGNHTVTAIYNGDGNYNSVSASTTLTINDAPPVSLSCSPNTLRVGAQTTCTASVPPGAGGTVALYWPTTLTGQWWNGDSASWYPQNGGNLATPPLAITHDGSLNYNLSNSGASIGWTGAQLGGPAGLNPENIYVRWTGTFVSSIGGTYAIGLNSDDGASLYVNGTKLIDNLSGIQGAVGNLAFTQSGTIDLTAGATNTIVVEYQQNLGGAGIQLLWMPPGFSSPSLLGWTVAPVDSSGHASVAGDILVAGSSTVSAVYSGDVNYPSTSASTTVSAVSSTVTELSSDVSSADYGQNVTLSALINTGGSSPSGSVAFLDSGNAIQNGSITQIAATNLAPYSQQVGNPASWGGYCGPTNNMTMNTSDIAAPDGSYTATKFITPSTSGCGASAYGAIDPIAGEFTTGQPYTASIWLRAATEGANIIVAFDDCSVAQQFTVGTTWKRYSISTPAYNGCHQGRGLQFLDWDLNVTYYVWGAQVEQSQTLGPYIETDASQRSGYGGIAITTSALGQGSHAISASYSGDAQNSGSSSLALTEVVTPPVISDPVISSLSVSSGPVGTTITVSGSNFGASQGSSTITFNGVLATPTSWNDTTIVASVPNDASSGNVLISVNGHVSNGEEFFVGTLPSITAISLPEGPIGMGVRITGQHFGVTEGASTVQLNGVELNTSSWDDGEIIATIPVGAIAGSIIVTVQGGASNGKPFKVDPAFGCSVQ